MISSCVLIGFLSQSEAEREREKGMFRFLRESLLPGSKSTKRRRVCQGNSL
jgi:hypothetical protein